MKVRPGPGGMACVACFACSRAVGHINHHPMNTPAHVGSPPLCRVVHGVC